MLARYGDDAKVLAGGQSLGPLLNLRLASPAVVVDVNRVAGLDGVEVEDGHLRLGAIVRQRVLERDARVLGACPLLAEAAPLIGHVAIRNRGTVGGSLAHADPAAELPAVAFALQVEIELASSRGRRTVRPQELFVMPLVTSIAPDELLVAVRFPVAPARTAQAWVEVAERHGDFAIAGVAAAVTLGDDGVVSEARLAYAGVGPVPYDGSAAASRMVGEMPSAALYREVGELVASDCDPQTDLHGSSEYRRRLVRVLTERALTVAASRASV